MRASNRHYYEDFMPSVRGGSTLGRGMPLELTPHYSNPRFNCEVGWKAQTVFGVDPGTDHGHAHLFYVYSDRLQQWDYEKEKRAWTQAKDGGRPEKSADFLSAYLSAYFDKPIIVDHVLAGVNRSNGYPYFVLGYREIQNAEPARSAESSGATSDG